LARVKELQDQKAAAELAHEKRIEAIAADYDKEKINADRQRDIDIAAAVAGTIRLRDPGRAGGAAQCDRGAGPAAAAATGQRDAGPGAELSAEAAQFLLGEANRADAIVRQLGAAQAVIREQIRTCNPK
jgi:hypothetical protein